MLGMIFHGNAFGLLVPSSCGSVFNHVLIHFPLQITVYGGICQKINLVSCVGSRYVLFLISFLVVSFQRITVGGITDMTASSRSC